MIRASIFCAVIAIAFTTQASAAPKQVFDIPAQRLDAALARLGQDARMSIGSTDPRIAAVTSRPVRGTMSVDRALRTLLQGTGFAFVRIDSQTVRIVQAKTVRPSAKSRPPAPPPPRPKPQPPAPVIPPPDSPPPDIVVTATKQGQSLTTYPGTAHVEDIGSIGLSENLGSAAFVARVPSLTTTNLGTGRNKIFVRGIADSSFSGPTQSTVGLYLGDLRLTYNAPEPDLRLYDINRVEVIEGPQGTLYGAGALGGVIRIIPNMADASAFHTSASGGVSTSSRGSLSSDLSGMVNLPIVEDKVALRVVGYRQIEGGYINNSRLGTRNTNRTQISGARANLRINPGDGWTVDLGTVSQNIDARDGQYAERSQPEFTHAAFIAQPHDNDFWANSVEIHKDWGALSLVSSTGLVRHSLSETFDATGYQSRPGVLAYQADEAIRLLAHETRLSRKTAKGGSWVFGISALRNTDHMDRFLGPVGSPAILTSLRNIKTEFAFFGEATKPIGRDWSATLGGRFFRSITEGELLGSAEIERRRKQSSFLPTAALSWRPVDRIIAFMRYQSGFRSGGLSINNDATNSVLHFDADEIQTTELGLRFGEAGALSRAHVAGGISAFFSRWRDIQADLISPNGLPFTDNIGRGIVNGIEANVRWRPTARLTLESAFFFNHSALTNPAIGFAEADRRALPNIAQLGGHFSFEWEQPVSDALIVNANGTLRYVGGSNLGTIAPFILEHGETMQADVSAELKAAHWAISLDVTNLFDRRGNNFSYGNPFTVSLGQQTTPLRPRTVRLGVKIGF